MATVSLDDLNTVTIDRGYLETLIRRAKLNAEPHGNNHGASAVPVVSISHTEYDRLQTFARQYDNLRRNLLRGGVGADTVDLLSMDDTSIQENKPQLASPSGVDSTDYGGAALGVATPSATSGFFDRPTARLNGYGHDNGYGGQSSRNTGAPYQQENAAWAEGDAEEDGSVDGDTPVEGPVGGNDVKLQTQRPQFDRQCTRTIQLLNLAEGTTHADITSAVRGGMLLDVFVRSNERTATVSFLYAANARAFYDHVRKHDLYIKNKRVDLRWSERQFILPGHVAGKVGMGATRNLIIRQCGTRHTDASIRDDLDHIHNLVVIKVEFSNGNCHIHLNSVHNSIYARMCMMSRFKYKGTKIEWDVDECAQPYDPIPLAKPRREVPPPRKPSAAMANRFQLLNMDDEDDDEIAATFQSKKSVGIAA